MFFRGQDCAMMSPITREDETSWQTNQIRLTRSRWSVCWQLSPMSYLLPGGDATSIHLGNAVCVIGALLVGGFYGGLGGAIGMTIGDLLDPVYIVYAPKTFICKLCIGLIAGFVAHRLGKIDRSTDKNHILGFTIAAAVAGLLFNVIADPLIGYYYKLWIIGKPAAELTLAWNIAATSINAVTSTIASVVIYMAVRPALRKAGFLDALSVEARA